MSDLVRYDPLEHGRLAGGLKEYRGFTQKDARAAADDTALTRGFKNSMRSARMGWNALTGDKEELGRLKAEDMDYRKIQEGRKSQARRELGEAWEKGGGVGGGLSNVWGELKKDWREKGLDGALEDVGEMGGAVLEQAPNALVPIATTTAGGILGALAGGNAAVGAYAGATLGNTLMEYGGQLDRAAEAAGVDPADKDAVMAFIGRGAPGALKNAAVKGAVVGAADMAAMKLGGSILNMGKKAAGKAALEKMGVAAADKAAVAAAKGTPEFAALAKESAKGGLGGAARHAAAYATESAGEFAGEYLGTGLANGEWDEKGAALEAFSSLGHSAVGFAGTKAYAAVTDPLRPPAGRKAGAQGGIGGNRKAGRPAPEGAQALRAAAQAAADGGAEQGGAGFDTAHHDQSHPALRQFADRTKQEEAGRFFSGPADGNTPHAEELARGTEKQPDVSGIPSEDGAEFLDTGVMPDGLARQYADMAAKYRAKPSEAVGIDPDDGAVSAAAALAADSGAAVPSAVSDDMEARSVADDAPSGRSADADRGGVPSAYGNVRPGGAPRGAASVAPGGSAAAASGGIARVSPLPAGQYFDGLDTRGRKALAKEAGLDIKGVADFGQIAAPVRRKIEQAYHARIEADYQAASEAKQGYLPPPVRMADAVPVPKKGFSVPADALDKESRRRFDALPEWVRRHAQTVADYTADGIMRREAGMADMRGHYPEGLAESAAADGKPAGRAQPARAKDTPVAGKAAAAKNAATEKPSSDKVRNIESGKSHFDGGKGKSAAAQGAATEKPSSDKAAKPETFAKTASDNPEEARRKARVLQGGPVYTVKERQAPQGFKALREHAENIKKRLAESIGGLAERVDVAAVSETAPDKAQMLLSQRVEGWFDGRTGKITLVAENLTPERAVWAAWHELGHRGFAADGFAKYREELERADGNGLIRRIADAVQEGREGTGDAAASVRSAAVEEAVAELYAAQRTGGWAGIENRYGVKVGNGLKRGIAGVLARIGALLRRVLQRLAGKAGGAMSDADVFAMLADLHGNVEGARDAPWDGNHRAVMFARAEDGAAERSKSESLEKLRRAETIRISGREVPEGGNLREYKRNALEYGKSLRGPYVNKDTGREISLGRSGITEILRHDYKDAEHLQSIAAIPQIIENAVYIDTLPNEDLAKNGDIQGYEYYVSGLNVGGADYTVRAAVAVSRNGNRYYDHKLTKIEKGNLLSLLDRVSTTGASESKSPLSGIDDKRLLQILQDKDAGKGGIADFDTEAVRFSRAANIGAAISRITGKKSDLRNALKDRWDASKGIQLQFLGRRQIEDIYGGVLDGLKEYGRLSELFGADANKAVTEADKVVREWGRLKEEDAKALADLMHDATLAKVDADPLMRKDARGRLDGIRTALDIADGKIAKARAAVASAGARTARADAAYNKAQRAADKAAYALEKAQEKHGREILADEADMRLRRLFYADSEAKRALRRAGADAAAESRAKTDAVRMLEQARADVKRLEKDEVGAQKALEGLALLNRRFAGLPDAAQRVYRKARDDYRAHFGQVRDALAERLARAGQDAETVRRLKERFDNELGGVYFPLARFGDYLVVVKDADGNSANVSRAETLSEAEKLRDALKADFGPGFKVSPVMKSRDYIRSRDAVGSGFMKELGEAVGRMDLDPAQRARLNDTLTQLYLNSLPDTSWAKHGIHRKGVPGFSDDARRAYAQNMGSGANYLAKLRYADRMAEQLDVMQDFVDGRKYEEGFDQRQLQRVADEMRKRHEAVMNPNPSKLAQALTGFGFLWMMGMSPASAVVNLSQTAMVAYPVMAAKWGYAGAARELLRASKQIGLRFGEKFNTIEDSLNGDEKAAFRKAADYGVIDLSQAHDLAGVANGDPGLAGSAWQKVMDKAAWLFHHAEKFNRQVTFVAAYRLAKRAGADSEAAFEQAKKATYDGHFDYAAQNRPRFMMGNAAKVVFLFKQYSQNILYALGRNAYLAFKGDKEARKTLAGLLVSHAMASGILGLPFVSTLLAVASMLGSDDDDPWDAEAALRNMLADTFGDKAGEVLAKGFSRLTPLDVSGRLGLDQLVFPDIQDGLEGKKWAESLVVGSTGAVVGAGIGAADGVRTRSSVPRTANTLSLMKSW
ncbi:PLxRFG domain-containing protein [Neisseria gonorrhoeae]